MEPISPIRSGFLGVLLAVVKLSVLLVQNRAHLYSFLLLKIVLIVLFNHWLSGLAQQAHPPPGLAACPLGHVLRAGLALVEVPVRLVLRVPRLLWAGTLGCARALCQAPQWPGAWECLGLSPATWMDLLLSCLHSLILLVLPLLLMIWRLCWKAHHCGSVWLPSKALLENCVVLEPLALLKRLCWRVESMTVLTSWHLAYLVTWTTCLASHLLQATFEPWPSWSRPRRLNPGRTQGPCLSPHSLSPQRLGQSCQSTEPLGDKCVPIAFPGLVWPGVCLFIPLPY
ncbi:hypothetical protein MC885_004571 [Smutsia gigantea]|nr:hypothetical protein MC885_004571 [Smutsia gigantea]